MKEQLESVVLQMYRAGVSCSEAVREFQKASSSQCSRIREGISAKLPRDSAYIGIRCVVRSKSWRLTSARHALWEGDQRDQRFQSRCDDGQRSNASQSFRSVRLILALLKVLTV
jgi:hypothetical protein